MIRMIKESVRYRKSIPRESGDDPGSMIMFQTLLKYSPRERG